jgi:hypothetical protein
VNAPQVDDVAVIKLDLERRQAAALRERQRRRRFTTGDALPVLERQPIHPVRQDQLHTFLEFVDLNERLSVAATLCFTGMACLPVGGSPAGGTH